MWEWHTHASHPKNVASPNRFTKQWNEKDEKLANNSEGLSEVGEVEGVEVENTMMGEVEEEVEEVETTTEMEAAKIMDITKRELVFENKTAYIITQSH